MINLFYLSCSKFTCSLQINIQTGEIVSVAPIIKKFKGQKLENLLRWMENFAPYELINLDKEEK